jgi:hypothetical protein
MTNEKTAQRLLMTRRNVLGGATVCAFGCLLPGSLLSAMAKPGTKGIAASVPTDTNLYAFRGPGPKDTTAIALTWRVPLLRTDPQHRLISQVRIHCGTQQWDVKPLERLVEAATWEEKGCRMFAGNVSSGRDFAGANFKAVVVEVSTQMLTHAGSGGIWAEWFTTDGERGRMGSPFLARILAANLALGRLYHRTSPKEDKGELMEQLAAAIAAKAREQGTLADPDAHGRRLAEVLLPDVLRYDPNRPFGFTFAGQNGRHPHEASASVVESILTGELLTVPANRFVPFHDEFPYFARPSLRREVPSLYQSIFFCERGAHVPSF